MFQDHPQLFKSYWDSTILPFRLYLKRSGLKIVLDQQKNENVVSRMSMLLEIVDFQNVEICKIIAFQNELVFSCMFQNMLVINKKWKVQHV